MASFLPFQARLLTHLGPRFLFEWVLLGGLKLIRQEVFEITLRGYYLCGKQRRELTRGRLNCVSWSRRILWGNFH